MRDRAVCEKCDHPGYVAGDLKAMMCDFLMRWHRGPEEAISGSKIAGLFDTDESTVEKKMGACQKLGYAVCRDYRGAYYYADVIHRPAEGGA